MSNIPSLNACDWYYKTFPPQKSRYPDKVPSKALYGGEFGESLFF